MRERILLGLRQSAPFSSLQRRIITFNLAGLAFLVMGVLYLNQLRSGLIDQRVDALRTHAQLMALTIAETTGLEAGSTRYDPVRANVVLSRLVRPAGVSARLYDTELRLTGDTDVLAGNPSDDLPVEGISKETEVMEAVEGRERAVVRNNARGQLVVSVAVPLRLEQEVLGALVLTTQGGDIDALVRGERVIIFQVFLVASIVSMGLSILLANTIATPIKRLAEAADNEGTNAARPINPDRVEIPDMTDRSDEIGELSAALIRMTEALYKRIEAIEAFASDVAHEIKNPLTSMRSAVETMQYARTPEQRQRLLDVIAHDVGRMDRLVTDISNASRLDAELVREKMARFDLGRLVGLLVEVTRAQAEKRDVAVVLEAPEDGAMARGLEGRIAQVITNLLDNALSFSPEGGTITVTLEKAGGRWRLAVADEGPGVPPANIESVFERFYTERPDTEGFGNHSGLGLSISKQIVEAHGGRIWVENILPEGGDPEGDRLGARFQFVLPA